MLVARLRVSICPFSFEPGQASAGATDDGCGLDWMFMTGKKQAGMGWNGMAVDTHGCGVLRLLLLLLLQQRDD